jgi:peroxiredoxin
MAYAVSLFLCFSFISNKDEGYKITVHLRGLRSDSVYLYNTLTNKTEPTAVVNERFSFAGKLGHPDMFQIYFDKAETKFLNIFLENSRISITGHIDSLEKILIKGSECNTEYLAYRKSTNDLRKDFMNKDRELEKALDKLDYVKGDSLQILVDQAAHRILESVFNYASLNKNSLIVPNLVHAACFNSPDRALANKIIALLSDGNKSNPRIAALDKMFDDLARNSVGNKAADFEMATNNGKVIRLSSYKGKVVLLDFWASWCGPCIKEFPGLKNIYDKFKGEDFEIIGFSIDKNKKAWDKVINTHKLPWPQVVDLNGPNGATAKNYGIIFIPTVYLIGKNGAIAGINLHGEKLTNKIKELIKQ